MQQLDASVDFLMNISGLIKFLNLSRAQHRFIVERISLRLLRIVIKCKMHFCQSIIFSLNALFGVGLILKIQLEN